MMLLEISDAASSIGDNRISNEIDKELFDLAVKLGYKYCRLLELKVNNVIFDRHGGAHGLLLELRKQIPLEYLETFTNNCVIKFVLTESKYGYLYTGIVESIYSIGADIEIYTLNYLMKEYPKKIREAFYSLCNVHLKFITANGGIKRNLYELNENESISNLEELVRFQLNYK